MLVLETPYSGKFTLPTQLMKTKLFCTTTHKRSTTVSLETYPLS